MSLYKVFVGFVCSLMLVACSDTNLRVLQEPPTPPPPPNPQINVYSDSPVDPLRINYGDVNVGNDSIHIATIESVGDDTLQIQDLYIDGPSTFVMDNSSSLNPLMAPGDVWELEMAYRPNQDESVFD